MGGVIVQKVTFTNSKGDSIELYQKPFFLNKIEGLGDVDSDIQSQKAPYQDGSTYINATLSERYLPIEVIILDDVLANRQYISRVFNPKFGEGLLTYENDKYKLDIYAASEHVPKFNDVRPRKTQKVVIDLVCNNPFWMAEEKAEQLVIWEGGLEFPLQLPTFFATKSQNMSKIIENVGDVETPIYIVFNGPATSPIRVDNVTTGEFIEVNQDLLDGERIEINTAFGQKKVKKILADGTEQNAFHSISLASTFFNLEVGNNLINYSTGAQYETAAVSISYHNRYVGI